jgi:hypothetical protein
VGGEGKGSPTHRCWYSEPTGRNEEDANRERYTKTTRRKDDLNKGGNKYMKQEKTGRKMKK